MNESKTVVISNTQFKHFRALCGNRDNWTDGGHWNGIGKEPNCAVTQSFRKKSKIVVRWPTEESAKRWNDDWAQAQRNMGYVGTGFATLGLWYTNIVRGIISALAVNIAYDVLKGESIAALPHPEAKSGWRMVTELELNFKRSVHPWQKDTLKITRVVTLIDDKNQKHQYSGPQTTTLMSQNNLDKLSTALFGEPGSITSYNY